MLRLLARCLTEPVMGFLALAALSAGIESFKQAYATDEPARMMSSFNRARKKKN